MEGWTCSRPIKRRGIGRRREAIPIRNRFRPKRWPTHGSAGGVPLQTPPSDAWIGTTIQTSGVGVAVAIEMVMFAATAIYHLDMRRRGRLIFWTILTASVAAGCWGLWVWAFWMGNGENSFERWWPLVVAGPFTVTVVMQIRWQLRGGPITDDAPVSNSHK